MVLRYFNNQLITFRIRRHYCKSTYTQGQYNPTNPKIREYFYYIDHNGMLFLADSRMKNFTTNFKDPVFLSFFFRNLKTNNTNTYPDFPYVSYCGPERNYTQCDDLPIVYTKLVDDNLLYNYTELSVNFTPSDLKTSPSGRLYHPFPTKKQLPKIGLVSDKILSQLEKDFIYDSDNKPVGLVYKGKEYFYSR